MSYKIIDLPALGRQFNATDIIEVSADGTGSYKANIGDFTLGGENYIFVNANGTPAQNGQAVKDAYDAAQAMTPNGNSKSATNRVTILLSPGYYTFNEAGSGNLNITKSYIDFVSLSGSRDVYFSSIQVYSTSGDPLDIYLSGIDTTKNNYYTHAAFCIASSGDASENIIVKNCKGGDYSFSSFSSGFRGLYENCEALSYSFCSTGNALSPPAGIVSTATGNIINYGDIVNCNAVALSFVSENIYEGDAVNYGTIKDCISSGVKSFCFSIFRSQNVGIIKNCESDAYSFCSVNDAAATGQSTNSGYIVNCSSDRGSVFCHYVGSNNSVDAAKNLGLISNCYALDDYCFVMNTNYSSGNNSGSILNCYNNGEGFCGSSGQNSGRIIECTATTSAFCMSLPSYNSGQILRCTMLTGTFTVGTPSGSGRVVLGIDTTGVVNF